ncbi:hypothetical protein [Streptomyces sp. NBC_01451]|uniref:hypothetical protein n=1 Tax=Streptomyces sp. NBC_01451 TaxID=2903872 RepID=UPI002E37702E|nr:hypothetical protein [Streptomyces sp. NBC_01451]
MVEQGACVPVRTLVDLYVDRDLADAQVRRLVALLGLRQKRRTTSGFELGDGGAGLSKAA